MSVGNTQTPYDPSKDQKKKKLANSFVPAWKYGLWPDDKHDQVQCALCEKTGRSRVKRLKSNI